MTVIKRYPNRKLYDTEAKRYITLNELAGLLREGREIQVVDNASGEDLTAVTLSQIIFAQEKKQRGALPQAVLSGLVQMSGNTLDSLWHTVSNTLDLEARVDEEIERRIEALVQNGEMNEKEGQRIRNKLVGDPSQRRLKQWPMERELEQAMSRLGIPNRQELDEISKQIEALAKKIDEIC